MNPNFGTVCAHLLNIGQDNIRFESATLYLDRNFLFIKKGSSVNYQGGRGHYPLVVNLNFVYRVFSHVLGCLW